ncbi:MAG: hypothetical protein IT454_08275 [Planctomycetes bacterium]|nr:hypothetical protein [Planctomycetota bacterium]
MSSALHRAALALTLAACSATSNPDRSELRPVVAAPPVTESPTPSGAAAPPKSEPGAAPESGTDVAARATVQAPKPAPAPSESAPAPSQDDPPRLRALGSVGGRAITAEDLVARMWVSDSRRVRDALEQIVFADLATLEADRLALRIDPKDVDAAFERALSAIKKKHEESGSKLSFDEYIERVLELTPERYYGELRVETVVQMLAERAVRVWGLENESADVRVTELRDAAALELAKADIGAGKSFDELAQAHGRGDDPEHKSTAMTIVRAEAHELSRVVFATPVGSIAGPIEQNGRWLFIAVDRVRAGREGSWAELGPEIERELAARPVTNLEFMQWHAAMRRRYRVELAPFFDFVDPRRR